MVEEGLMSQFILGQAENRIDDNKTERTWLTCKQYDSLLRYNSARSKSL